MIPSMASTATAQTGAEPTRPTPRRRVATDLAATTCLAITGPVYLAYPLHAHGTPYAARMVRHARRRFHAAEVLPACSLYASNADWLRRWPTILPTLSAVAVFADPEGWVGCGVWAEVRDARQASGPIYFLDGKGRLHAWERVQAGVSGLNDWRRHVAVSVPNGTRQPDEGAITRPRGPTRQVPLKGGG